MEHKFKVGDRVEIIDNRIFNEKLKVGDVGEIKDIDEWGICIDFLKDGCHCQLCSLSNAQTYIKLAKPEKEENSVIDVLKTSDKYREMLVRDSSEELKKIIDKKSLDEQIKYHEEQLKKLKAQKEKEKWVFTEDEKVILRNIDKQYKWLGRDVEGTLWFYDTKPVCPIGYGKAKYIDLFNHLFRCIKIQDEPCEFRKYI